MNDPRNMCVSLCIFILLLKMLRDCVSVCIDTADHTILSISQCSRITFKELLCMMFQQIPFVCMYLLIYTESSPSMMTNKISIHVEGDREDWRC